MQLTKKIVYTRKVQYIAMHFSVAWQNGNNGCVVVLFMKQGMSDEGLGEEMYFAHRDDTTMPTAVELSDKDSDEMRDMKTLILHMTSFEPAMRPPASEVYHEAATLFNRLKRKRRVCVDVLAVVH